MNDGLPPSAALHQDSHAPHRPTMRVSKRLLGRCGCWLPPREGGSGFCRPVFQLAQFCSFKDVSWMFGNTMSTKGPPRHRRPRQQSSTRAAITRMALIKSNSLSHQSYCPALGATSIRKTTGKAACFQFEVQKVVKHHVMPFIRTFVRRCKTHHRKSHQRAGRIHIHQKQL